MQLLLCPAAFIAVGWLKRVELFKGLELAKLARMQGQQFESATWLHKTDKSRGYCLEMICADFLAGANLDSGNPEILLQSISRYFRLLPDSQQDAFRSELAKSAS